MYTMVVRMGRVCSFLAESDWLLVTSSQGRGLVESECSRRQLC